MMFIKQNLLLGTMLLMLAIPFVGAAATETLLEGEDVVVTLSPEHPGAYDRVTVRATSYTMDISKSMVSWSVNGVAKAQGVGVSEFIFTTGAVGEPSVVTIAAQDENGAVSRKQIAIIPADLDLVWQSTGYVPGNYRGKALLTTDGTALVVAFPHIRTLAGKKVGSQELFFEWFRDGERMDSLSGYGKDRATFTSFSSLKDTVIRVRARTADEALVAESLLPLRATKPQLLLYEESPLTGANYTNAYWDTYEARDREVTLRLEPYYIPRVSSGGFEYGWTVNDTPAVADPDNSALITLRQETPGAGEARLGARIKQYGDAIVTLTRIYFGGSYARF